MLSIQLKGEKKSIQRVELIAVTPFLIEKCADFYIYYIYKYIYIYICKVG